MPTWLCKIGFGANLAPSSAAEWIIGGVAIALLRWVIREDLWTELAEPGAPAIERTYVGLHTPDTDPSK